jgi:hypothetical protein
MSSIYDKMGNPNAHAPSVRKVLTQISMYFIGLSCDRLFQGLSQAQAEAEGAIQGTENPWALGTSIGGILVDPSTGKVPAELANPDGSVTMVPYYVNSFDTRNYIKDSEAILKELSSVDAGKKILEHLHVPAILTHLTIKDLTPTSAGFDADYHNRLDVANLDKMPGKADHQSFAEKVQNPHVVRVLLANNSYLDDETKLIPDRAGQRMARLVGKLKA